MTSRTLALAALAALTLGGGAAATELSVYGYPPREPPDLTYLYVRGTRTAYPRCYQRPPFFCGPRHAYPGTVEVVGYATDLDELPNFHQVGAPIVRRYRRVSWRRRVHVVRVRG